MAVPRGVRFNKSQTEYQLFPEEYFSATDCTIYMGDVWVDDITGLSFTLQENVQPIYGYASRTWDYVLRGRRMVRGQIRIAFREAGYLYTIFDHIGQMKSDVRPAIAYMLEGLEVPKWTADVHERIEDTIKRWNGAGGSKPVDRLVPRWSNRTLTRGMVNDDVKGLQLALYDSGFLEDGPDGSYGPTTSAAVLAYKKANGLPGNGDSADSKVRDAMSFVETVVTPGDEGSAVKNGMAEARMVQYEKEIWGRHSVDQGELARKHDTYFYRGRTSDVNGKHTARLYQDGIDIYINYGPLPQFLQQKISKATDSVSFNTTVRAIRNVQIGSVQQIIDANTGQAIEEVYEFIAQDMD